MARENPFMRPFPSPSPLEGYPSPFEGEGQFQLDPRVLSGLFNTGMNPFGFGGQNFFPQQEPAQEQFSPEWMMPEDVGFSGLGPDMSGMDPGFMAGGNYPNSDPGFTAGGRRQGGPALIPELEQHDNLPDGGADAHPGFLEFMQQQNPLGDIGIKAAILARSFTNPSEALQWAVKLKENETQRQFQAMQAQARQQNQKEIARIRGENEKAKKKGDQFNREIIKLEAAIRSSDFNPDQTLAEIGPPTEENLREWQRRVQVFGADKAAKDAEAKESKETLGSKIKILSTIHAGSTLPDSSFPEKIRKDKDFLAAAAQARTNRDRAQELEERIKTALARVREAHAKSEDPEYKVRLALAMGNLKDLQARRREQERSRRNVQAAEIPFSEDPIEAMSNFLSMVDDELTEGEEAIDAATADIGGIASARGEGKPTPEGAPKKTETKKTGFRGPTGRGSLGRRAPSRQPTPQEIRGFGAAIMTDPERAKREWQRQFPGVPLPTE